MDVSDECATFVGDEDRARQAVANLLSNAVKFTDPGGSITVTCSVTSDLPASTHLVRGARYVAISVADTGIGIEQEDLRRIFQPFMQLEAAKGTPYTRARAGAGLGLSISRQLAHLMSGDITVESELGRGSTFTLWLPASSTLAHAAQSASV